MVSKQHCPVCGFLMMYELKDNETVFTCVNTHDAVINDEGLGPNLDILLEFLKRPWLTIIAGIVPKNYQNQLLPIRDSIVRRASV